MVDKQKIDAIMTDGQDGLGAVQSNGQVRTGGQVTRRTIGVR